MDKEEYRHEFEQLLYDDKDFKNQWGNKSERGYDEKSFNEWINIITN